MTDPAPAHRQCSDGVLGNGACLCFPDYKGVACHICSNPNKHGDQCQEGGCPGPAACQGEKGSAWEEAGGPRKGTEPRREGSAPGAGEALGAEVDVSFTPDRKRTAV